MGRGGKHGATMKYVSTRGQAPALGFADVLLAGLAGDGGLYVPETWPAMSPAAIAGLAGRPYADAAFAVIRPFVGGEIGDDDLRAMCESAYAGFRHPAVAPLIQIAPNEWVLELFHGPTLAFKDVAMQLLARLMDHVLAKRGSRVTIVGATSGDTGAAAIEAFRGRGNADVFILFPEGRVSPIQQRQMTTVEAANVHAVAVKGTFDDCQAIVKGLFGNARLRDRLRLAGVNSINWARILGQIVYYFTAAVALGGPGAAGLLHRAHRQFRRHLRRLCRQAHGPADRSAGHRHQRQRHPGAGARHRPLRLARGRGDRLAVDGHPGVVQFRAPAVRGRGRDAAGVRRHDAAPRSKAAPSTSTKPTLAAIRADFSAGRADEAETAATIRDVYAATGFLPDPHTAVGLAVAGASPIRRCRW